jgi:hypothetical protein
LVLGIKLNQQTRADNDNRYFAPAIKQILTAIGVREEKLGARATAGNARLRRKFRQPRGRRNEEAAELRRPPDLQDYLSHQNHSACDLRQSA